MIHHRSRAAMLAFALLLCACQQADEAERAADENPSEETQEEDETPPVPVQTRLPERGDVYAVYSGTAAVEAYAEADVIARVAGEVREILVEEGDEVVEGQVLARLDGDRLRLELNESAARLRRLQRDYERNVNLREQGLISEGDFDRIKYDLEALEAEHNLASLELDYTQIRAPIGGVVSERYIKLGNTLSVDDRTFRVTSLDPLVAYLFVPEREFQNIRAGQPVALEIDALGGPPRIASVTRVSPIVDPVTGTFKITIEIYDDERRIKPGMFARIGVVHDTHANALQVPRSALVEDLGEISVFVVENGTAVRRIVETGYSNSGMVEIVSGLDDADEVITVGQVGLQPDAPVEVINAEVSLAGGSAADTGDAEDSVDATTD